jgi:hypothetical protein
MKKILIIVTIVLVIFSFSVNVFADYSFLSLQSNAAIEQFKEKYRVKEIVSEEERGFIWAVILPKNDGIEEEEIKETIYNDETGEFEAIYNFTHITIFNAQGPTRVIYGSAAKFHPYDQPKLTFLFDS